MIRRFKMSLRRTQVESRFSARGKVDVDLAAHFAAVAAGATYSTWSKNSFCDNLKPRRERRLVCTKTAKQHERCIPSDLTSTPHHTEPEDKAQTYESKHTRDIDIDAEGWLSAGARLYSL